MFNKNHLRQKATSNGVNQLKKQINILEFLKPTWGKLTTSIIFLLIFFLLPLLGILLKIHSVIIFWLFVMVIVSLPLSPIIKALGLTTTSPIYLDAFGGPTPLGLIFIGFFWVIILYLISCLVVHRKKRK